MVFIWLLKLLHASHFGYIIIKANICSHESYMLTHGIKTADLKFRVPTGSGKHGKWVKKNSMHGKIMEFEN